MRKTCRITDFALACLLSGEHHYRVTRNPWPRFVKVVDVKLLAGGIIEYTLESDEFTNEDPIDFIQCEGIDCWNRTWLHDIDSYANGRTIRNIMDGNSQYENK